LKNNCENNVGARFPRPIASVTDAGGEYPPLRYCRIYSGFQSRAQERSSVWSAASPRRFSFHTTQSGEDSPRSKRSASMRRIPISKRL